MDPTWRRTVIALVFLSIALLGYVFLGGWLFTILAIVGLGLLMSTWIAHGGNDMYGTRTRYPKADDLVRADDHDQPGPHPGPLPPQPPGW